MPLFSTLCGILPNPAVMDVLGKLVMFLCQIWLGIVVGVLVGWVWKPKWAKLGRDWLDSSPTKESPAASSSSSPVLILNSLKFQLPSYPSWISSGEVEKEVIHLQPPSIAASSSSLAKGEKSPPLVGEEDLEYIFRLVEEKDGGPAWIHMMDKSSPNMYYQAWRRDIKTGPPQFRTRSVYEDSIPEVVRDFFWDDEFRLKWDDMLVEAETLEECPTTGTVVHRWVRKFPFFCSDREYVIGRRIWKSGKAYYCVTKGVQYPSAPRHEKPRRVDLYYSSWCIRPVESRTGNGHSACEVLLFHYEDMGIPWELTKLGVRQGMWGTVKKIDRGLRLYQKEKAIGAPLSHSASMAHINTKVSPDYLSCLEQNSTKSSELQTLEPSKKPEGRNIPKLAVVGGALILAFTLDRGLLTKAVIFGAARRFANIGRRL